MFILMQPRNALQYELTVQNIIGVYTPTGDSADYLFRFRIY